MEGVDKGRLYTGRMCLYRPSYIQATNESIRVHLSPVAVSILTLFIVFLEHID